MIALAACLSLALASDIEIKLPPVLEQTLENGARLLAVRQAEVPLVHYLAVMDAGSCRDPERKEGLASLVADLLDQGTAHHPGAQFEDAVDLLGAELSAVAGRDSLVLSAEFLAKDAAVGRDLFCEALLEPELAQDKVDSSRKQLIAQVEAGGENVGDLASDVLCAKLFAGSPYAHPPEGTVTSLERITRDDVVAFHRSHFAASSMVIVAVGDLDPPATLAALAERFRSLPKSDPKPRPPLPPAKTDDAPALSIVLVDNPEALQTQVRLGWRSVAPSHPDAVALEALSHMIGGGFTSRLVEHLRVDLGLSYDVANELRAVREGSVFMVTASTKADRAAQMAREMTSVVQDLSRAPLDEHELERAKRSMLAQMVLALETPAGFASMLADLLYNGSSKDDLEKRTHELAGLGTERCREVIDRHVVGKAKILVVLGNARQLKGPLSELGSVELRSVASELK
jgi:zinc protease